MDRYEFEAVTKARHEILMGSRIREIREDAKISQEAFATILRISQPNLSLIEKGIQPINRTTAKVLSLEFFVDEDWLETGEGDKYNRAAIASFEADEAERARRAQIAKSGLQQG